jgi:hypothetical protein
MTRNPLYFVFIAAPALSPAANAQRLSPRSNRHGRSLASARFTWNAPLTISEKSHIAKTNRNVKHTSVRAIRENAT